MVWALQEGKFFFIFFLFFYFFPVLEILQKKLNREMFELYIYDVEGNDIDLVTKAGGGVQGDQAGGDVLLADPAGADVGGEGASLRRGGPGLDGWAAKGEVGRFLSPPDELIRRQ